MNPCQSCANCVDGCERVRAEGAGELQKYEVKTSVPKPATAGKRLPYDAEEERYLNKHERYMKDYCELKGCWMDCLEEFVNAREITEGRWLDIPDSVFSIAIASLMSDGLTGGKSLANQKDIKEKVEFMINNGISNIVNLGIPLFVVGASQAFVLYKLWRSLPVIYESTFCSFAENSESKLFLICVIGIFIVSMLPGLIEISKEFSIIRTASIYFSHDEKGDASFKKILSFAEGQTSYIICYLIVLYELTVWTGVTVVGILYITTTDGISSNGIGDIVQATVAIGFINSVDNMAAFLYGDIEKKTQSCRFRCRPILNNETFTTFMIVFLIPAIVCTCVGVVVGFYNTYC